MVSFRGLSGTRIRSKSEIRARSRIAVQNFLKISRTTEAKETVS